MDPGVVALRGLQGRGYLHCVDIARLHLGLHQKVQDPVELLGPDQELTPAA